MFYLSYIASELRRRRGRTFLTSLGLGVGVALVVAVSALSSGLDRAQHKVLEPLTGVGTDLSVSRPLRRSGAPGRFVGPGGGGLSTTERSQLRRENGGARIGLLNLGKPGAKFTRDDFVSATQLSFSGARAEAVGRLRGVQDAAGGLTLNAIHVEGTVPERPAGAERFGSAAAPGPPDNINLQARTVSGVDQAKPSLGLVTPGQIGSGRYFSSGNAREAILNVAYARREGIAVGDKITLKGKRFRVVGLAKMPLGGNASDLYVKLAQLQKLSGRAGRINTLQVRASSAGSVASVEDAIKRSFPGAQVTTAADLAGRVKGSLSDAKNLSGKLGTALVIVGLGAAFLLASLLTLSSVAKRTRELGTLKALGWPQRLVVRQVTGEALVQGALGGVLGAALGIGAAELITAIGPTLQATVAQAATNGPGPLGGPFGQGRITGGSTSVALDAPIEGTKLALGVALALAGGLLAGGLGALRTARLRPADALRQID